MDRKTLARVALAAALALLTTLASAAADIDLTDFNEDVMKGMDDTVKALDSDLATRDAKSAQLDARSISEGLHWAEEYFARKGNVADAVQMAKQGEALAGDVGKSAAANDFDAALTTYDTLVRTCRRCHDVYKPPDL
jgi:cytochrome c556